MKVSSYLFAILAMASVLAFNNAPVVAGGKTPDVIEKSNGFPSGMHFNLNIHGKDFLLTGPCTAEPGGNSVFIDLYGATIIEYVSDKVATELWAVDPCGDDGKVTVAVPKQVSVVDDTGQSQIVPVAGYHVFGRILAKPQNGKDDPEERSNILFSPNTVTSAVDIVTGDDGQEVSLGLITWNATYYDGGEAFYRFEDPKAKGRGKSKARDMTHLFEYTGWVVDPSLDTNGPDGVPDGEISILDVPLDDYDNDDSTDDNRDFDNDGDEDVYDVEAWLETQGDLATYYFEEWIFNIADMVTAEGEIVNDGTKLFQTRLYPYFDQ